MLRRALPVVLLLPLLGPARGREEGGESDKVSNDRPDRPLQMLPASTAVKEAFDDFERFRRRGAWERALKALYTIPEDQAARFVDGRDGFVVSVDRRRREVLAALPPEGLAAYRLFYDPDAKKLLDQAEGPDEARTLERIFSAYFHTAVGAEAADRLGELHFRAGRFDRAAECWLAILRDRPDSELPPALISVKAALALARAGRGDEVEPLRREVRGRHAEEVITVAGRKAPAAEQLDRILGGVGGPAGGSPEASSAGSGPNLPSPAAAAWQVRFAESVSAGMAPTELAAWETHPFSGAVPAVAVADGRLYANYLGHIFAVELATGKMLWRSASFHNVEVPARQDQSRMIDPGRFAILAGDGHCWSLGRDLKDPNAMMAVPRLTCRRAEGGDVVWQTSDLPDYAQVELAGTPILAGGTIYAAARTPRQQRQQNQGQEFVLAIRARDGKLLWKATVGTLRQEQQYYYYGMPDPSAQPRLAYRGGAVFVDTHVGVLARLDAETGELDWGYAYATEPANVMSRFFFPGRMAAEPRSASSEPLLVGSTLLVKGEQSDRLAALDADRMARLWDRPIARSARLLGSAGDLVYLGGPEISALHRESRELKWSTRLPGGSTQRRVLVGPDGLWQMTPRGIFELDAATGGVRRIVRGEDTGSDGGDLYLADRLLVAVTNRTISAYPRTPAAAEAAGRGGAPTTDAGGSDD